MVPVNLHVGWIAILAGLLAGAAVGTFFHDDAWLGGYGSWRRRMLRLGHISLVGTGLLNLAFALSIHALQITSAPPVASALFIVGAATMPLVCLLSAWHRPLRHLFFVPVVSLLAATGDFLYQGLLQ